MLFSVGTKVRFLHSRDEGVVISLLEDGMVLVRLDDDDFEIPVFQDDIIRKENSESKKAPVKAKFVAGKKDKTPTPPERPPIESQYTILKSMGIQLAFDAVLDAHGHATHYRIFLINDTSYDAIFVFELYLDGRLEIRHNSMSSNTSIFEIGVLQFDQLNDSPLVKMDCWRITTQGTGPKMHKTLRLKPKVFFKSMRTAPFLNKQVHLFRVFEKLNPNIDRPKEDLKTYTKKNARPQKNWLDISQRMPHEVEEMAAFIPEIDLHIDALTSDYQKMSNAEILNLQLSHFNAYIRKAIRLGVERVFIIHGIGKGKLRNAIASQLLQMEEVSTFRNEFHPRYGYGATEVIF